MIITTVCGVSSVECFKHHLISLSDFDDVHPAEVIKFLVVICTLLSLKNDEERCVKVYEIRTVACKSLDWKSL